MTSCIVLFVAVQISRIGKKVLIIGQLSGVSCFFIFGVSYLVFSAVKERSADVTDVVMNSRFTNYGRMERI